MKLPVPVGIKSHRFLKGVKITAINKKILTKADVTIANSFIVIRVLTQLQLGANLVWACAVVNNVHAGAYLHYAIPTQEHMHIGVEIKKRKF